MYIIYGVHSCISANPLTSGAFCQKCIFWTFWRFSDPIYSKKGIWNMIACLSFLTSIAIYNIYMYAFLDEEVTPKAFFLLVLVFLFSAFLIFLCQWLTFYWACFWKFQEKHHWERQFYDGVVKCSRRNFCLKFFTQISEHVCSHLSDLGIIGKIFSSCRT